MKFDPTDDGPFWMNATTREKTRKDVILSGTQKKRMFRIDELQQMLIAKGLTMKGRLKDLQAAAQLNGIPIEEVNEKVIEGRGNKAKGLLQVLWERGRIDPQVNKPYHYYTIYGKKDIFGNLQTETSLCHLMEWIIVLTFKRRKLCCKQWLIRWGWKWTVLQSAIVTLQVKG
jgi:hypothetical protein